MISEVFYPGWQATVDGQGVEILRANYAFRAVYLPPGKHRVRFSFLPLTFTAGALISGLTLAALAMGLLIRKQWLSWGRLRGLAEHVSVQTVDNGAGRS